VAVDVSLSGGRISCLWLRAEPGDGRTQRRRLIRRRRQRAQRRDSRAYNENGLLIRLVLGFDVLIVVWTEVSLLVDVDVVRATLAPAADLLQKPQSPPTQYSKQDVAAIHIFCTL